MSASCSQTEAGLKLALICGLLGLSGATLADELEVPDPAFLEYLGSWEESDEDWVLFSEEEAEETPSDKKSTGTDPAPRQDKVAEVDDER